MGRNALDQFLTCAGRGFDERRDAAILAVLKASGTWPASAIDPHDPRRGDVDRWQREITVRQGRQAPRRGNQLRRRPDGGPVETPPRMRHRHSPLVRLRKPSAIP
jgi:hypothetical protein